VDRRRPGGTVGFQEGAVMLEACRQLADLMGWNKLERVEFTDADQLADLIKTIRQK
jgi:CTP synthase (UTP-ammonia lyase)